MGTIIAGVDEVGRGPLAGAVVAAAVIFDPKYPILGLKDSKKLSEKKREALYEEITQHALAYALGRAEVDEIDTLNILQASLLAMKRAVMALPVQPTICMIDGNSCPELLMPCEAIIKGDSLIPEISAASIVAKVTRDREMLAFDKRYPGYGFAKHKGYPTPLHLQALAQYGILPIHRRSFGPVKKQCLLQEEQA